MTKTELTPGAEMYSVATGKVDVFKRKSRMAAKLMGEQDGFMAVHHDRERGACMWFYATEADAKRARNVARANGIQCGKNIARFVVASDGVPEFSMEVDDER